jgi:hypothetical protein
MQAPQRRRSRESPMIPASMRRIAAAAFLARHTGRTFDAYRQDLRCFFAWANDAGLVVLAATRPHIELYRHTWTNAPSPPQRST